MTPKSAARLLDALAARHGLICAVGAGGKKSTLQRLAEAHLAAGTARIGFTCTVMMAPPPASLTSTRVIAEPEELANRVPAEAPRHPLVLYARRSRKAGRLGGLPPELIAELHGRGRFIATLVKADGARMRMIKAPLEDEPVLPPGTGTLLALVSARALGQPLSETIAHRLERVTDVTGAALGECLTAVHLARLLVSDRGALHGVGDAIVVPIINMVDEQTRLAQARDAARRALAATERFDRVVLAEMTADDPVVEVVTR
jgi:probable selenium-dependent hydroxylase accessory protein YqeC